MCEFRIMTYNMHKGIGGIDRRYNPQRIIDTIQHYQPDFLLLQEVDHGVPRSRFDRQVELLCAELGFENRAFQANVKLKQGHYGNAILSRVPIVEKWNLNLMVPMKKRRRALVVKTKIHVGGHARTLLLGNTHLGLAGYERKIQIRKLLRFEPISHLHRETPAIIGGDFNDIWSSLGRKLMFPEGFQCAVGDTKTFPAVLPVRSLDAIYYRGDLELKSSFAGHTQLARAASDHLPVIADFAVRPQPLH